VVLVFLFALGTIFVISQNFSLCVVFTIQTHGVVVFINSIHFCRFSCFFSVAFSNGFSNGFSCWDFICCCGEESGVSSGYESGSPMLGNKNSNNQSERLQSQSRDGTDSIFEPFFESSVSSRWTEDARGHSSQSRPAGDSHRIIVEEGGGGGGGDYYEFQEEGHHHIRHHDGSLSSHIIPPEFNDGDDD
jgi:hypothetical protein